MPGKTPSQQWNSRRFMQALLIGVTGSTMMAGSALAQSCNGASGGTVTVSSSNLCSTITLSNGTNLQVTNTGSMTNIFSGNGAGNITINGTVARTGGNAIGGSGSIGSLTLGPGSTVSAIGAVHAIDYRSVSALASFTNNGAISSSTSGFATRNSTVNGGVINNGTFSTFSLAIQMVSSIINGDVTNSATGTITTTSAGNISGSGIRLDSSRVTGNVTNAGRMNGQDGGITYGFLISNTTNVGGSFINSGTISGTTSLYNHGAFIQSATFGGTITNTATGIINTSGRGLFLNSVTASALQNQGSITTGGEGMRADGGTLGSLSNSGSITTTGSGSMGILSSGVTYNGAVNNSGSINSLATGLALSGGTINGNVTNTATGTITTTAATGTNLGISSSANITGSLVNEGTITGGGGLGTGRAGISTSGGSIGANLANNGTISGYTSGVSITTTAITGNVVNGGTGVINATGVGVSLDRATAASLQNLNAISAVTQGVNISGGTVGSVLNGGTIITSGTASENNGVYLLGGARITGEITNSGRISGQAGAGSDKTAGIRLSGASLVSATLADAPAAADPAAAAVSLVNSGTIQGYNYGIRIDASTVTGSVTNNGSITSVDDGVLSASSVIGGDVSNTSSGVINAGGYGFNIANFMSMGAFTNAGVITSGNSAMFASTGAINGDVLNTGAITTTGTASTSNGVELQAASVTGNLTNAGTMSGQAGTGGATTSGVLTSGGSIAGAVTNSGTISGYDYGLRLSNTPIAGALTNGGGITSVADAVALSGASIGGDVSNTSSGVINAGGYGFNIANFTSIGAFTNAGAITSGNSAMFASTGAINGDVLNTGAITTTGTASTSNGVELQAASVTGNLINAGAMSGQAGTGGAITSGILASGGSIAGRVINSGNVSGYTDGFSLSGTTVGGAIDNTGGVYAARYGFNLADAGTIGAFNNFGSIAAGMAGVTAAGSTQIQTMTNAQGVGNSAGPLTYSGTLPSNYFIVINGASYGQLGVDPANHAGQMTFGISSLSNGVAPRIYSTVLTGVSIGDLTNPNSVQATFGDRGKLVLRQQAGSATSWDLSLEGFWNPYIGFNNPNVGSTYQALNANRMATEGVLHQRYAVLNAVMQYDCDRFDKYGVCLQFLSRETGFGTQSTGAGVLNASYRVAEKFRIGAYLDYQAWARTPFGLAPATGGVQPGYNNATFGGYVGFSERDDQTGMQARISGGYNGGRVTVMRAFLSGSEPGFGDARMNAFYLYGVAGYGVKLRDGMIVTPYGGMQFTGVTREAYMETFAPETIFPLIYNPYYERLITGLAGVKINGMLDEKVGYQASLGGQFDLSRNANAYGGMSAAPGMESFGIAHGGAWNGVRPSGMAGVFYAPLPNHRLSLNGYANQQAWTSRTYVSGLLGYQIGF